MIVYRIDDVKKDEIKKVEYDLGIFSSGYEERCTYVSSVIDRKNIDEVIILGFDDHQDDINRKKNDDYFSEYSGSGLCKVSDNNEEFIYRMLSRLSFKKDTVNILVDYSSMTRSWYAAIINYFRYNELIKEVYIYFSYSMGEHSDSVMPLETNEILCIPGCEGGGFSLSRGVAFLGLGFDGLSPLTVIDQLEPDISFAYLANPGVFDDYPKRTYAENKQLLEHYIPKENVIELPINSVEFCFNSLAEMLSPFLSSHRITFVPLGPKPHVLTAILLAMKFPEISCLHVSGKKRKPEAVVATGSIVSTRVHMRKE